METDMKAYASEPKDIIQHAFNTLHTELIDAIGAETDMDKRAKMKNYLFNLISTYNQLCRVMGVEPKHDTSKLGR